MKMLWFVINGMKLIYSWRRLQLHFFWRALVVTILLSLPLYIIAWNTEIVDRL